MLIRKLQKSENRYLQNTIFCANLLFKEIRRKRAFSLLNRRYPLQYKWDLHKFKTSDTIFILGSGASVASYTKKQFDTIAAHDSIGFNFWLLHWFLPTYYTVELSTNSSHRTETFLDILEKRAEDYRNIPVIFKYSTQLQNKVDSLPEALEHRYLATSLAIPGTTKQSLHSWLRRLDQFGFFSAGKSKGTIIYRQASLSWLISFALQLGYKNIVLCGVDLNQPDYFYDIDDSFLKKNKFPHPDSGFSTTVHPTDDAVRCKTETPISVVLSITRDTLLSRRNAELYIGSKSSALYPELTLYPW